MYMCTAKICCVCQKATENIATEQEMDIHFVAEFGVFFACMLFCIFQNLHVRFETIYLVQVIRAIEQYGYQMNTKCQNCSSCWLLSRGAILVLASSTCTVVWCT